MMMAESIRISERVDNKLLAIIIKDTNKWLGQRLRNIAVNTRERVLNRELTNRDWTVK